MNKIPTVYDRDWDGHRGVIDDPNPGLGLTSPQLEELLAECAATEKLDGTNVRMTVRAGALIRVEARVNPSRQLKDAGVVDPWYRDAWQVTDSASIAPADKHLVAAAMMTDLGGVPDGEHPGEAIGPRIQGNPLDLEHPRVVLFSLGGAPALADCPVDFDGLRGWLPHRRSQLNVRKTIEGIVWHHPDGRMLKLKAKDFR